MATKVKGDKIKESSIPLSALDDKLQAELNCKYGLSEIVCILNSNNTTSDIFPIGDYFVYVSSEKTIIKLNIGGRTNISIYAYITSEVISESKVKFSFGGGNISHYGNLIIGNKYNEVPTPTPDWNAQEGEAGYIENRTHFAKYIPIPKDASVGIDVSYAYDHDRDVHYLLKDIVVEYKYSYHTIYNKVIIPAGTDINGSVYVKAEAGGGPVTLEFSLTYDNGVVNIRIIRALNFDFRVVIYNILDDIYLPDTILKTTPQTLSDTDKNQALANLGIDPVVWKYMCNPNLVQDGLEIPNELLKIVNDKVVLKYKFRNMYDVAGSDVAGSSPYSERIYEFHDDSIILMSRDNIIPSYYISEDISPTTPGTLGTYVWRSREN